MKRNKMLNNNEYEAETVEDEKQQSGGGQTSSTRRSVRTCLKGPPVARQNGTAILTHEIDGWK